MADMNSFDWTSFTRKIAVKAPMPQLYAAWTCTAEIEKWFLRQALFMRNETILEADVLAEPGDTYAWNWYGYDVTENGRITAANGYSYLQFSFAGNCLVDVSLEEQHGFVVLELKQHNIPVDEHSKREIRLGCASGWSFFLLNLKSVYEGGLDLRNRDERFTGHINN